jgi:hypothetical protein
MVKTPIRLALGFGLAAEAVLGAFLVGLAFLPDLPLAGATLRARFAAVAFFAAFGWSPAAVVWAAATVSSVLVIMFVSPFATSAAVITFITPGRDTSKRILWEIETGERRAMGWLRR